MENVKHKADLKGGEGRSKDNNEGATTKLEVQVLKAFCAVGQDEEKDGVFFVVAKVSHTTHYLVTSNINRELCKIQQWWT